MPFRLVTLGGTDLTRPDGVTLDAILSQPKRLAVLVYLVLARPARFVRRDLLISLFWPELDQEHARGALRQAARAIRREMGEATLVNRGDEEIGLAEGAVVCDAVEFREAVLAGHPEVGLALYSGDFLPGFHLEAAAPEFGAWLDDERARLRALAANAASGAANLRKAAGDTAGAVGFARRACEFAQYDEARLRTLMGLLDASGDRAEALHAYEDFTRRLAQDLEVTPSTQSRILVRNMRARATPIDPARSKSGVSPSGDHVRITLPVEIVQGLRGLLATNTQIQRYRRLAVVGVGAVAVIGVLAAAYLTLRRLVTVRASPRVVVAVFENRTGDASLDGIGDQVADGLTRSLATAGGMTVVDARARLGRNSARETQGAEGAAAIARVVGADLIIWGNYYYQDAERLRIEGWITEGLSGALLKALDPVTGTSDSVGSLVARLGGQVAAAIRGQPSR